MRILFDQGTPVGIKECLQGHTVMTAYQMGWSTLLNGELLQAAENAGFDLLLTTDQNLAYQQNLQNRNHSPWKEQVESHSTCAYEDCRGSECCKTRKLSADRNLIANDSAALGETEVEADAEEPMHFVHSARLLLTGNPPFRFCHPERST